MPTPPTGTDSRRGFLKRLFAAAAAGGALATTARAGGARADQADVVGPFRVGDAVIADHVVGPLVYQTDTSSSTPTRPTAAAGRPAPASRSSG